MQPYDPPPIIRACPAAAKLVVAGGAFAPKGVALLARRSQHTGIFGDRTPSRSASVRSGWGWTMIFADHLRGGLLHFEFCILHYGCGVCLHSTGP